VQGELGHLRDQLTVQARLIAELQAQNAQLRAALAARDARQGALEDRLEKLEASPCVPQWGRQP
jgi:hypothetical protein